MPDLAVVVTTYMPPGDVGAQRMGSTLQAIKSWDQLLGPDSEWPIIVADDGSDWTHLEELTYHLDQLLGNDGWSSLRTNRLGCGGAFAAGVRLAIDNGATAIFYAQDDWELVEPLDLVPALKLLRAGNSAVRLGPTHPNLLATVTRLNDPDIEWTLNYVWAGGGYVVGWRPAIYDAAWLGGTLGGLEGLSAIEAERIWLERIAATNPQPLVAHAPNCTLAGPFRHLETVELGEDAPATLTERYAATGAEAERG